MAHTIKQLSDLAGISVRTLHYYDEIGLLKPASHGRNRYRYYGDADTYRLQQILFYRELGLSLSDIRSILDQPDFEPIQALQAHRQALRRRADRLNILIQTIDKTITHLKGQTEMNSQELFTGFENLD